jgi:hypothetical protein
MSQSPTRTVRHAAERWKPGEGKAHGEEAVGGEGGGWTGRERRDAVEG